MQMGMGAPELIVLVLVFLLVVVLLIAGAIIIVTRAVRGKRVTVCPHCGGSL